MVTTENAAPTADKKKGGCRRLLIVLGILFGLTALLTFVLVVLGLIRANKYKAAYDQGQAALEADDCETALEHFEAVRHPNNLFFAGYTESFDEEVLACERYLELAAIDDPEELVLRSKGRMQPIPSASGTCRGR